MAQRQNRNLKVLGGGGITTFFISTLTQILKQQNIPKRDCIIKKKKDKRKTPMLGNFIANELFRDLIQDTKLKTKMLENILKIIIIPSNVISTAFHSRNDVC